MTWEVEKLCEIGSLFDLKYYPVDVQALDICLELKTSMRESVFIPFPNEATFANCPKGEVAQVMEENINLAVSQFTYIPPPPLHQHASICRAIFKRWLVLTGLQLDSEAHVFRPTLLHLIRSILLVINPSIYNRVFSPFVILMKSILLRVATKPEDSWTGEQFSGVKTSLWFQRKYEDSFYVSEHPLISCGEALSHQLSSLRLISEYRMRPVRAHRVCGGSLGA